MTQRQANRLFAKNKILVPIFWIRVSVFFTKEEYTQACQWRGEEVPELALGIFYVSLLENKDTGDTDNVLMIGIFRDEAEVIVHEATHAALWICDYVGHKITKDDEILPYLTQYLFAEISGMKR